MADYAPATLLVAIGAFLMSFLPFQHAFAKYRASSYMLLNARVSIWAFVTIALAALLVFVLVRGIYRTRRAAPNLARALSFLSAKPEMLVDSQRCSGMP